MQPVHFRIDRRHDEDEEKSCDPPASYHSYQQPAHSRIDRWHDEDEEKSYDPQSSYHSYQKKSSLFQYSSGLREEVSHLNKKISQEALQSLHCLSNRSFPDNLKKQPVIKAVGVNSPNVQAFNSLLESALTVLGLSKTLIQEISDYLCHVYDDQIQNLTQKGMEKLVLYVAATLFDFLQSNQFALDKPWQEQLASVLQKRYRIPEKEEVWEGPSQECLESFGLEVHEELETSNPQERWVTGELFIHCGIRTDDGKYFADVFKSSKYGFRVGTEEEAHLLEMQALVGIQRKNSLDKTIAVIAAPQLNQADSEEVSSQRKQQEKFWEDVKRRDLYEKREIEREEYIESHHKPVMKTFYHSMRSYLNRILISVFALNGGFVERRSKSKADLGATGVQALTSVIPEPITRVSVQALTKCFQIQQNQNQRNRTEKAANIVLDPYIATEYARQVAIRLCEIYEEQVERLTEEGGRTVGTFCVHGNRQFPTR
ncbi:MAG: hypothetical protein WB791_02550 [Waddliaceae bacterium]